MHAGIETGTMTLTTILENAPIGETSVIESDLQEWRKNEAKNVASYVKMKRDAAVAKALKIARVYYSNVPDDLFDNLSLKQIGQKSQALVDGALILEIERIMARKAEGRKAKGEGKTTKPKVEKKVGETTEAKGERKPKAAWADGITNEALLVQLTEARAAKNQDLAKKIRATLRTRGYWLSKIAGGETDQGE